MVASVSSATTTYNLFDQEGVFSWDLMLLDPKAIAIDPTTGNVTIDNTYSRRQIGEELKQCNSRDYYRLLKTFKQAIFHKTMQEDMCHENRKTIYNSIKQICDRFFCSFPLKPIKKAGLEAKWNKKIQALSFQFYGVTSPSEELTDTDKKQNKIELRNALIDWKRNNKLFLGNSDLNAIEERQLQELLQDFDVVNYAVTDPQYANYLFENVIERNLPVFLVVRQALLTHKFVSSKMVDALGRGGKKVLRIQHNPSLKRSVVEMKICDQWHQIDLEASIHMDGIREGWTMRNLFRDFKYHHSKGTEVWQCFPAKGFIPWDNKDLAWTHPDGTTTPVPFDCLEKFPDYDSLSFEDLQQRYGEKVEKGKDHFVVRASGATTEPDLQGWHGFSDLVIYQPKTNQYKIYPFGAYAKKWPNLAHLKEAFLFLSKSVKGKMTYPDIADQSRRIQCFDVYPLSKEGNNALQTSIYSMLDASRKNNLLFQMAGENCMQKIETIFNGAMKSLRNKGYTNETIQQHLGTSTPLNTSLSLFQLKPNNFLLKKIVFLGTLSKNHKIRMAFLRVLIFMLGFFRKTTITMRNGQGSKQRIQVSVLSKHPEIWEKGEVKMPAKLLVDAKKGKKIQLHFGWSGMALSA